ncbi:hypothetical protein AMEX_G20518 [Astyanax mexicanus]|uniref:Uncharacterized protein n=1 Tax=Astyanax mexicanus TaxID=7994 RepID=A0A8T2L7P9_ASTMX|nr:hypothetical protein AMEX_G20518 [Astyanax mexicanus]
MALKGFKGFFKGNPWSGTVLFNLVLVVLEKLVENDFVCPCRPGYTQAFFALYLIMPMTIAFVFGVYLFQFQYSKATETQCCRDIKWKILCLLSPPIVWIILFISDGRYLSCLLADLHEKNPDSTLVPLWQWCSEGKNLTQAQQEARKAFYITKLAGFGCLLAIFLIILIVMIYTCLKPKTPNEQVTHSGVGEGDTGVAGGSRAGEAKGDGGAEAGGSQIRCCSVYGKTCGASHCKDCCSKHRKACCLEHRDLPCLAHSDTNATQKTDHSDSTVSHLESQSQPTSESLCVRIKGCPCLCHQTCDCSCHKT